jgi:hypothetical protein
VPPLCEVARAAALVWGAAWTWFSADPVAGESGWQQQSPGRCCYRLAAATAVLLLVLVVVVLRSLQHHRRRPQTTKMRMKLRDAIVPPKGSRLTKNRLPSLLWSARAKMATDAIVDLADEEGNIK